MLFVTLGKYKKKLTKEMLSNFDKYASEAKKEGVRFIGLHFTLGRYDFVAITEAPDEKTALKNAMGRARVYRKQKPWVAVNREDVEKWLG